VWKFRAIAKDAGGAGSEFAHLSITVEPVTINSDFDGDGMPDQWELSNGLNPCYNDAARDLDGDGLANLAEYVAGRDPRNRADGSSSWPAYRAILRMPDGEYMGLSEGWVLSKVNP